MLYLSHHQIYELVRLARAASPNEACGLLSGVKSTVHHISPARNTALHPRTHFQAAAQDIYSAMQETDAQGWQLIGVFHSHPQSPPIPSPSDIADSRRAYPQMTHVIVSLAGRKPTLKAWHISQTDIAAVDIVMGSQADTSESALTTSQITAILAATLCAVLLLIMIAVSLLPPAPLVSIGLN